MVMKTQLQIFYEEQRKIGERDRFMMDLIRDNDLTNQHLERPDQTPARSVRSHTRASLANY
jgi:hypothetical protein